MRNSDSLDGVTQNDAVSSINPPTFLRNVISIIPISEESSCLLPVFGSLRIKAESSVVFMVCGKTERGGAPGPPKERSPAS